MSNEYSFNMSEHPLLSEWLYLDRVCTSIRHRQNLSAELWQEGEKMTSEAFNIVLEHFFLYHVPNTVYNPNVLKVDENDICFSPGS